MFGLVDGNNFFVSCERVFDRSLVGRPVAVLSNNDGCCVSRSDEFKALGRPVLVGISRKSFIYKPLGKGPEDVLTATQVLHMAALERGADILRVHDVAAARETLSLYRMLKGI